MDERGSGGPRGVDVAGTTTTAIARGLRLGLSWPQSPTERDALREHLVSSAWGGLSYGLISLTDVILAKTLGAPGWQITLLATLAPAANLTSVWWAGQVENRRKAGFFLLGGLLGRLPLLVILATAAPGILIALNFLFAVASALIITAMNTVLQQRYSDRHRARWFGLSASIGSLSSIVAIQAAGVLLERNERAFPWLLAFAGVAGFISCYHFFRMEGGREAARGAVDWLRMGLDSLRRRLDPDPAQRVPGLADGIRLIRGVMRENPGFVRFERSFMIYGFAFMIVLPVLPLYVVRDLKMSYQQLASTKGIWSQIGLVVLSPLLGAWLGRLRPLLFTGRVFLLLAFYPLFLLASSFPTAPDRVSLVYLALVVYSVAMTGVNLSWSLGSMHFAEGRDASAFQGVHVALTGARGLLGPGLGFLIYRLVGSGAVFALSALLFALAGVLMLRQHRDERDRPPPGAPIG